ncbi:CYTH and CHAD domain-containing protein [Actinoplanes sp. NPDC051851]|uniref:CYTH and CHAD domain-containing protein n=1 Tax=Actinoplanes sp. NPDC051851 TaxID=3154753 RepID=UPI003441D757
MEIATETERKYDVPETFRLPDLAGVAGIARAGGAETHDLDATYFDTDDLRLMKSRRTLRRRSGGNDAGWHLKTPDEGSGRTEHRIPDPGGQPDQGGQPGQHDREVPDELVRLVRPIVRRHPLGPVARLVTHRVETPLLDVEGRTLALVAQDRVRAEAGDDESAWQEIEVELVDGGEEVLDGVEGLLLTAGASHAAGPSKVARALARRLDSLRGPKGRVNPVFAYAREQRDAIVGYDPAARAGEADAVHRMRVAVRRLRSTLKTYRRWFPETARTEVDPELRWLARMLGGVRDPQVLTGKLLAGVEFPEVAERIRAALEQRVHEGREQLGAALDADRYLDLLDRIDELVDDPGDAPSDPARRTRKILKKADARLDAAVASGVDERLHEARKTYKQARYAVEVIAPAHGKPAKRLVKALTALQDGLGAHQDSAIARETLREIGSDSFDFGVLYGRQEQVGKETLLEVPALVRASRRKKVRRWLVRA